MSAIVGPIAGVFVDKAAARAGSVEELYRLLSLHIENGTDRECFLQSVGLRRVPAPSAETAPSAGEGTLAVADVQLIANILARYLGPIAPIMTRREAGRCGSAAELKERLSVRIPTAPERAEFLRQLEAQLQAK